MSLKTKTGYMTGVMSLIAGFIFMVLAYQNLNLEFSLYVYVNIILWVSACFLVFGVLAIVFNSLIYIKRSEISLVSPGCRGLNIASFVLDIVSFIFMITGTIVLLLYINASANGYEIFGAFAATWVISIGCFFVWTGVECAFTKTKIEILILIFYSVKVQMSKR